MVDDIKTDIADTEEVAEDVTPTDEAQSSSDDVETPESDDKSSNEDKAEGDKSLPEAYSDFTMPEGIEVDETALADATPLFKELNLSQDQAQKLVSLQAKLVQEGTRKQTEAFDQLTEQWITDAKNDKEIGGKAFDENAGIAVRAVDAYGTPELKQLLESHGLGNHPEMIRFMWKVGKTLKEDVPDMATTGNSSQTPDRASIMYPKTK